jgi:hypothetical protein
MSLLLMIMTVPFLLLAVSVGRFAGKWTPRAPLPIPTSQVRGSRLPGFAAENRRRH